MSPTQRLTFVAMARVGLLAALFGVPGGLLGGAATGFALAGVTAFVCFGYYALKLAQLETWLDNPQAGTTPDGAGRWGDVLAKLYRLIRDERVSRQSLNDALSRFQQAAAALPDGAVMLDDQYNIVWCNPTAETHWGVSLSRDRQQTITYFIRHPEFVEYLKARNYGEPLSLKISRPADGGPALEMTITVQLVPFGDDQMLLLSRDVSERERLETMRRDFVANVSHELRTPLTVMVGFLETVEAAGKSNQVLLEKSLAHMSAQTVRMQRLVDDLLTLSRLEDNRNKINLAPVNVPELIGALVADAEQLSAGRHHITADIEDGWLTGSRDELVSAFGNLITNAVRYTPDGGAIEIQWRAENGQPVFRVHDNGEGIAPEHLPRLTERFYRVDRGRSRASGGTGLGLAIVKHVLIRHGAKLDVQSSQAAADHGTTFTIVFPPERACAPGPRPQAVAA
jgi:two-component system phosphate regulon sensor histidine kinase PhoR